MGIIRKMGREGDIPTKWSLDDEGSIQTAKGVFDDALRHKMLAFRMDGGEGEMITRFDKTAPEIVLIPQIAGGSN